MESRSNSLVVPPIDEKTKQEDKHILEGGNVLVNFNVYKKNSKELVTNVSLELAQGTEVAKVKRQMREVTGFNSLEFRYNNKVMIDPISLVDAWGDASGPFSIDVFAS